MRIALIIGSINIRGGGQRQILELSRGLKRRGHEVVLFTSEYVPKDCYLQLCKQIEIKALNKGRANKKLRLPLADQISDLVNICRLGWRVYRWKPDVINPHDWPANWMAVIAKFFMGGKTRVVWMLNDVWHVYNPLQERTSLYMRLRRLKDTWIAKHWVDDIVVLDHRVKLLVNKLYRCKATVVRSGLDKERFEALGQRQRTQVKNDELLLLTVGVFFRHRRFEDVILAIKQIIKEKNRNMPAFRYLIVGNKQGDLSYYRMIKSLIKSCKMERIVKVISKSISEEDLLNIYSTCDIFIFPNDKQTWGLAPLEAMALGKACIVSKGAGVHEVLTDGVTALLVEPQNPQQLADKLKLLLVDKKLRQRLGKKGRQFTLSNFSWEKYATEMEKIFLAGF